MGRFLPVLSLYCIYVIKTNHDLFMEKCTGPYAEFISTWLQNWENVNRKDFKIRPALAARTPALWSRFWFVRFLGSLHVFTPHAVEEWCLDSLSASGAFVESHDALESICLVGEQSHFAEVEVGLSSYPVLCTLALFPRPTPPAVFLGAPACTPPTANHGLAPNQPTVTYR